MSSSKYYDDNFALYSEPSNVGKIYFDRISGSSSPNPQPIKWMSNINLSRRDRSKNMYINPTSEFNNVQSLQINITQDRSNLLLLPCCINYDLDDDYEFDRIENLDSKNSGFTYWVTDNFLGNYIDIVVLTNGNVIDIDMVPLEAESEIIEELHNKNLGIYNIEESDIPIFYENGPMSTDDEIYQRYPNTLRNPSHSYIGNIKIKDDSKFRLTGLTCDTISYTTGNIVTAINTTDGGALFRYNDDYAKENNLVAVKFSVKISDTPEEATLASRIKIVSAVYDPDVAIGAPVESNYTTCSVLIIEFRLNTENLGITGPNSIAFDEEGTVNDDHSYETLITSTVPYTVGETNTGAQE